MRAPGSPEGPSVGQAGLPSARLSVDTRGTHGEAVAGAVEQVGGAVAEYAAKAKALAEETAATEAQTEDETWASHRLTDNEVGLLHKRGDAAMADASAFYGEMQHRQQETLSRLKGGARELYRRRMQPFTVTTRARVEMHLAAENRARSEAAAQAAVERKLNDIGRDYNIPGNPELFRAEGIEKIKTFGVQSGLPPEAVQAKVDAFERKADEMRLQGYLDGKTPDVKGAEAFLKTVKAAHREGPHLTRYEEKLAEVRRKQEVDALTAAAIENSRDKGETKWVNGNAAMDAVGKAPEELRKPLRDALVEAVADGEKEKARDITAQVDAARSEYRSGSTRGPAALSRIDPDRRRWLKKHAPKEWGALEQQARNYEKYELDKAAGRLTLETSAQSEHAFRLGHAMANNQALYGGPDMTPARFAQENQPFMRPDAYESAKRVFLEMQERYSRPDATPALDAEVGRLFLEKGFDQGAFPSKKVGSSLWDEESKRLFNLENEGLRTFIADWKRNNAGAPPPLTKTEEYLNKRFATVKVKKPGGFPSGDILTRQTTRAEWEALEKHKERLLVDEKGEFLPDTRQKPTATPPPEDKPVTRVEDIPEDRRAMLLEEFRRETKNPNATLPANVVDVYNWALKQGRFK